MANPTFELLEYLDDRSILNELPGGFRWLKRNQREDVIVYFETFAEILEEKLLAGIKIPFPMHHDLSTISPIFAPQIFD